MMLQHVNVFKFYIGVFLKLKKITFELKIVFPLKLGWPKLLTLLINVIATNIAILLHQLQCVLDY